MGQCAGLRTPRQAQPGSGLQKKIRELNNNKLLISFKEKKM